MARPVWKGSVSFGLVSVPVEAYPADQSHALSFAMLDKRDFAPVGYKRYNKKSGHEVPWEDIVKGYEYEQDQYVVMTDEDFRRANVKATQTIDIESFVPADAIPPTYFETPYYLVPGERGQKAYALLRDTLAAAGRIGIGQVVIRARQHLIALVPQGKALVLEILRYATELRSTQDLPLPATSSKAAGPSARELQLARRLIDDMSGKWAPEAFKDTYHADLMKRIHEKVKRGQTRELTAPERTSAPRKSAQVIDLMQLLQQSLDRSGNGGDADAGKRPAAAREAAARAHKAPAQRARAAASGKRGTGATAMPRRAKRTAA